MKTIIARRKIFITGGAGFIGANLVRRFVEKDYKVDLLLKKSTDLWRLKDILPAVNVYTIDLLDTKALTALFKRIKPSAIYHLAAYGRSEDQRDIEQMVKVNIQGTLSLLEASKNITYKLFVNIGSSSEYGFKTKPMKESDVLEPESFYGATKAAATYLCNTFAKQNKKPIVTIRPFSVFGPYEEKNRFIPTIMQAILEKSPIFLTPGKIMRDFIYIDDFVDACFAVISKANKIQGSIINIGTGKEYSNDEIVKILFEQTKKTTKVKKGAFPKRSWDTNHWVADIILAKKVLGWKPKTSLDKGLLNTYIWFENHNSLYLYGNTKTNPTSKKT